MTDSGQRKENEPKMIFASLNKRDQGWAWMVMLASFTVQLIIDGSISSFGILLEGMQTDSTFVSANYTNSQLNLPNAFQPCVFIITMGLIAPLTKRCGFQAVAVCGSLLFCVSLVISSFSQEIFTFVVFYGIFAGFGMGATSLCAVVCVVSFFDRYRGIASGIASAGSGFGYIFVPLLLNNLCQWTSWRKALLIYSLGSMALLVVSSMAFRPIMVLPILEEDAEDMEEEMNETLDIPTYANETKIARAPKFLESVIEENTPLENEASSLSLQKVPYAEGDQTVKHEGDKFFVFSSLPTLTFLGRKNSDVRGRGPLGPWATGLHKWSNKKSTAKDVQYQQGHLDASARRLSLFSMNKNSIDEGIVRSKCQREPVIGQCQGHRQSIISFVYNQHSSITGRPAELYGQRPLAQSHLHTFRQNSLKVGSGLFVGKPIPANSLRCIDSFYGSSLNSLVFHDKRIREAVRVANDFPNAISGLGRNDSSRLESSEMCDHLNVIRSIISINGGPRLVDMDSLLVLDDQSDTKSPCLTFIKESFDMTLYHSLAFWLITGIFFFIQLAYFIPFVYLIKYALQVELTKNQAVLLLTDLGVLNTIGRVFAGLAGDVRCLNPIMVSGGSCMLVAVCHLSLPFIPCTFTAIAIYAGVYGFISSVTSTLAPILIVRHLGLERLTTALGNAFIFRGLGAAVGPIIAESIDSNYGALVVFQFCGFCFLAAGLFHLGFYSEEVKKLCRRKNMQGNWPAPKKTPQVA